MAGLRFTRRWGVVLVAGAVIATSACGVRWETEPSPAPSPDAVTIQRDLLADAEAAVITASDAASGLLADHARNAAQAHLDVLGGVYVAFPDASPTPTPTASPAPVPSLADAIDAAREVAAEVANTSTDGDLAFVAASIDIEWALVAWWDAPADDVDGPLPLPAAPGVPSTDDFIPPGVTTVSDEELTALALAHDEARFAYETMAAQEFGPRREAALARAAIHAARGEALAARVDEDPRTPLYQLRDTDLLDAETRASLARSIETDLGWRYAALLDGRSASDLPWLLNGSFDAFAAAASTDGFTLADLPAMPGVAPLGS